MHRSLYKHKSGTFWLRTLACLALLFCASFGQDGPKRSLLVIGCNAVNDCTQETLYKFTFENGSVIKQETAATFLQKESSASFAYAEIVENRYLVSKSGRIYDMQDKLLFERETGHFVGYEDGAIFIQHFEKVNGVDTLDITKYASEFRSSAKTFSFDLAKKKYNPFPTPNFFSFPAAPMSPGHDKRLSYFNPNNFESTKLTILHRRGKHDVDYSTETVLEDFKASCGKKCGNKYFAAPTLWIDNDKFLTQKRNGELVVYDVSSHRSTPLQKINVPNEIDNLPEFAADDDGNFYYLVDKVYRIDIQRGTNTATTDFGLANGFKRDGLGDYKMFEFNDQNIGGFISSYSKTTNGYLAAEFQEAGDARSAGIRVWSVASHKWTTIRLRFAPAIVGWISD